MGYLDSNFIKRLQTERFIKVFFFLCKVLGIFEKSYANYIESSKMFTSVCYPFLPGCEANTIWCGRN